MKRIGFSGILKITFFLVLIVAIAGLGYYFYNKYVYEKKILQEMIARLQADSRIAEVLVTQAVYDPVRQKTMTTIKFLEFDSLGQPLEPKFFTFSNNIIQFQSLVIRFDDALVASGDSLKGKSVYLFWKAFVLDGPRTEEYVITPVHEIPAGYKAEERSSAFEKGLWKKFWDYALHAQASSAQGIKNAQIEAPGTKFIPGIVYTLKIEHDGGIRIDASEIPSILKGEEIL